MNAQARVGTLGAAGLETSSTPSRAEGWLEVGPLDAIPRLGARVVKTSRGDIAVFRTADDQVFALRDRCPHKGGPLSQGIVFGRRVACPLHNWVIALDSGRAVAPDEGCTGRFPVRVETGRVFLALRQDGADTHQPCHAPSV